MQTCSSNVSTDISFLNGFTPLNSLDEKLSYLLSTVFTQSSLPNIHFPAAFNPGLLLSLIPSRINSKYCPFALFLL
ncbi:hypothetical protein KsCSTR_30110 [Candidatus Kuenenia stuttgartiensis]|uniref:Uncharacterized protein n=1 Tax=Kuenenia stuttgartiensis TaxID=174633 RepID=Q1Q5K8_KUEST|nr:hypothetical protein KsCSTR_30110 [Candidatus Kuenenia stuttgartiensis]CAJ75289.1 unknown protein [Candidatus Kuenenia stuttgartiensis]